jgi:hypothetical protein
MMPRDPQSPDPLRVTPAPLLGRGPSEVDWQRWSRSIELKRRRMQSVDVARIFASRELLARAAYASFRIEGLEVDEGQMSAALAVGVERRAFRPRQAQRVRNHVAIQRHIAHKLRSFEPLRPATVVRWYTVISCGLCPNELTDSTHQRLAESLHRINTPELRLQAAVQEIARVHVKFINEPLVPSFNGILGRLLLRYHLGRCGFPPVIFHPETPALALRQERFFLPLLMDLLEKSYALLLSYK